MVKCCSNSNKSKMPLGLLRFQPKLQVQPKKMAKTLITSLIPMASLSYQCIARLRELHKRRKPLGQQQLVPPKPQKRRKDGNSLSLPKFQWCLQSLTKEGRPCRPMLPPVRWSLSKRVVVAAKEGCQTVKASQKKEGRQLLLQVRPLRRYHGWSRQCCNLLLQGGCE